MRVLFALLAVSLWLMPLLEIEAANDPMAQSPSLTQARPSNWAQPVDRRLNLYQVDNTLYRSALPDRAAVPLLQRLGITTVISFYQESDASWLHSPGVQLVHLPFHSDRVDDADTIEVLRALHQGQQRGKVLIHCKHGQDRTGLIAALYRMVYQGWSKEQAIDEMRLGGFGGQRELADAESYLRKTDPNAIRQALDTGACSTNPWSTCGVQTWLSNIIRTLDI